MKHIFILFRDDSAMLNIFYNTRINYCKRCGATAIVFLAPLRVGEGGIPWLVFFHSARVGSKYKRERQIAVKE